MAGLFCHEAQWRGETRQREKGARRGPGEEGELLAASQRGGRHVPDPAQAIACRTGLLSSPHQPPLHLQDLPPREPEPPTALRPAAQVANRSSPQDTGGGERMEPHADAKFKRGSQGHSGECGAQHKASKWQEKTEPDGPASPAKQAATGPLAQAARSCRPAGSADCGHHSPRLEPRLHSTPGPPRSPQEALAESAPPPASCSDSGTPLSPLFAVLPGVPSAPKRTARAPPSCGHGTSWLVRQFFRIHCLQGPREQPGGMGTGFPSEARGSELTGDWSEVTQPETTRGRTGSLRLRSELSTLARAWHPVSA